MVERAKPFNDSADAFPNVPGVTSEINTAKATPHSEVERPLFDEGNNWDFDAFKENLLDKENVSEVTELPKLAFLDGLETENDLDAVVLTSYPRSGNTMLRKYLEKIMGLVTGSDADMGKRLNREIMKMGLPGEGIVDKRVWVVKCHYPDRYGKTRFGAERAILLVRSPLDCIVSHFNMVISD